MSKQVMRQALDALDEAWGGVTDRQLLKDET